MISLPMWIHGDAATQTHPKKVQFERILQILSEFVCGRSEFYLRLDGK